MIRSQIESALTSSQGQQKRVRPKRVEPNEDVNLKESRPQQSQPQLKSSAKVKSSQATLVKQNQKAQEDAKKKKVNIKTSKKQVFKPDEVRDLMKTPSTSSLSNFKIPKKKISRSDDACKEKTSIAKEIQISGNKVDAKALTERLIQRLNPKCIESTQARPARQSGRVKTEDDSVVQRKRKLADTVTVSSDSNLKLKQKRPSKTPDDRLAWKKALNKSRSELVSKAGAGLSQVSNCNTDSGNRTISLEPKDNIKGTSSSEVPRGLHVSSSSINEILNTPNTASHPGKPLLELSNDSSRISLSKDEEEVMDFDNPLPEILQIVAESGHNCYDNDDMADAMDVDITTPLGLKKQLVFIPDTNVWIGKDNQALVSKLVNTEFQIGSYPMVVIPWMVLQEIDYNIHRNKTSSSVSKKFKHAAKFIHSLLSAKNPRVKGQKATEAIIGAEFNELMADDSILNCAIQYSKFPHFTTVFITNDVNLLNKALVSNLIAFKSDSELFKNVQQLFFESEIRNPAEVSGESNSFSHSSSFSYSPSASVQVLQGNCTLESEPDDISICGMDVDDPMDGNSTVSINLNHQSIGVTQDVPPVTFDVAVMSLKMALTNIIVPKMVEEYGEDGWKIAIKVKPPFTVESGLKCLQLHWIAVFSFVFPSKAKDILDELLDVFRKKPLSQNACDVTEWRLTICKLAVILLSCDDKVALRPRVIHCCNMLQNYIQCNT